MIENIKPKIKAYCDANDVSNFSFDTDIRLEELSDSDGIFIGEWNLSIAKPTDEQLNSYSVSQTNEEYDEAQVQAKIDLKASAKAKLIAGEALTEDEANTIVL